MSGEEAKPTAADEKTDKELSELLDSALDDFSKADDPAQPKTDENKPEETAAAPSEEVWSDEFIKQAAAQFESNMSSLLGGAEGGNVALTPEQLQESFKKMAEAASQVLENPSSLSDESSVFASTITQTLQGLSEGTESLQNPFNEDALLSMFGGASNGPQNEFLPFMQGMMQSLLSKEVLYPSLKDILEKYPAYLEENKDKLTPEDIDRYEKQQNLMRRVCEQLEKESDTQTPEEKKVQFEKVLALMQNLQDYGQPPTEIVSEGVQLDTPANLDPNQCCIA